MNEVRKGLYIEQKNNRSVFLMEDGQFVHGHPASPLSIGEEGYFYPLAEKYKWNWVAIFAPAIPIIAILVLFFSTMLPSENAFAYVQLEMDSSIEIGVDAAHRVVSIRELDEGGEELIGKLGEWKGEELDKLIERSISISMGEITGQITITTAANRKTMTSAIQLDQLVLKASSAAAKPNINVRLKKATITQRDESIDENIPVGQKVEHFISIITEDKSKMDRDAKIKSENYIKALKIRKETSSLKVKIKDAKTTSKSDASLGEGPLVKEKPMKKTDEPKASSKGTNLGKPDKTKKTKSTVKASISTEVEKEQEKIKASIKTSKPIVTDKPENGDKNKTDNELGKQKKHQEIEKEMQSPKPKELNEAEVNRIGKTSTQKIRKPAKGEVRHGQARHQEKPIKSNKEGVNIEKKEQK